MNEKTNIEILREFAKSTNRSIVDKETPYPLTGVQTFQKFKRIVYIPNNSEKTSFLVWFSDPYASIGIPTIFCGAFIALPSGINSKINIRKKNILDKLNVFSKKTVNGVGNANFESRVIISDNVDVATKRILSQSRIQDQLLKALDISEALNISINEYNIDFVPELKNTSYLSIINPQSWLLEKSEIEKLFEQIEKIRNIIITNE